MFTSHRYQPSRKNSGAYSATVSTEDEASATAVRHFSTNRIPSRRHEVAPLLNQSHGNRSVSESSISPEQYRTNTLNVNKAHSSRKRKESTPMEVLEEAHGEEDHHIQYQASDPSTTASEESNPRSLNNKPPRSFLGHLAKSPVDVSLRHQPPFAQDKVPLTITDRPSAITRNVPQEGRRGFDVLADWQHKNHLENQRMDEQGWQGSAPTKARSSRFK